MKRIKRDSCKISTQTKPLSCRSLNILRPLFLSQLITVYTRLVTENQLLHGANLRWVYVPFMERLSCACTYTPILVLHTPNRSADIMGNETHKIFLQISMNRINIYPFCRRRANQTGFVAENHANLTFLTTSKINFFQRDLFEAESV